MGGEAGKMEGVTFDISNKHRLGYSELQLIQTMVNGVNTLCAMDLVLQKKKKCNIYFFFFCSTRSMAHRVFTPLTIVWISCSSETQGDVCWIYQRSHLPSFLLLPPC